MEISLSRKLGIIRSLNISVACAVTLYEALRQKTKAGQYDQQKINGEEAKTLMENWGLIDSEQQVKGQ
jgi:tRNA (guanosine-2'-O-)-methyltransferase